MRKLTGEKYIPKADLWKTIEWGKNIKPFYNVLWVIVSSSNVNQLLSERKKLSEND